MHDGSILTLDSAIAHYASRGVESPLRSPRLKGFTLTRLETADLVAFLNSLTDTDFVTNPAFADPRSRK
jgi:cytochrome c peroxidase